MNPVNLCARGLHEKTRDRQPLNIVSSLPFGGALALLSCQIQNLFYVALAILGIQKEARRKKDAPVAPRSVSDSP